MANFINYCKAASSSWQGLAALSADEQTAQVTAIDGIIMRYVNGQLLFSPTDICNYARSEFASWMDRCQLESKGRFEKDAEDAMAKILKTNGRFHEAQVLNSFRERGCKVVDLSSYHVEDTFGAMREGWDVIYQGALRRDQLTGLADFLVRVPGKSNLGDFHYEVWDSKLARQSKASYLLQLCAYAEMLEAIQDVRPARVGLILGDMREESFRTNDSYFYYKFLKERFLEYQRTFDLNRTPDPVMSRSYGRWSQAAENILKERDSVFQVARITRSQTKKLASAGIRTMFQLSQQGEVPVRGIPPDVLRRLTKQAELQIRSKGKAIPDFELIAHAGNALTRLPPFNEGDIFFDMEGFPLAQDGLEYLWGYVHLEKGLPLFNCLWAHDHARERVALIEFIEFIHDRWLKNPGMHVYHYAAYEVSAITNLAQRYGSCEDKIDDLLRNGIFVDLYQIVRGSFVIGSESYSIKAVEHLYRTQRTTDVTSAVASVVYYQNWIDARHQDSMLADKILEDIRKYNEDDCQSTYELTLWLRKQMVQHHIVAQTTQEPMAPRPTDPQHQALIDALEKKGRSAFS